MALWLMRGLANQHYKALVCKKFLGVGELGRGSGLE